METYEIYWEDLNEKAQERLKNIYHDNINLSPLAILDIEEFENDNNDLETFFEDAEEFCIGWKN